MTVGRHTIPRRAAAVVAVALALAGGVALIATSGSARGHTKAVRSPAPVPAGLQFPHTLAGAVAAATAWSQNTNEAFINGTWNNAVSPLATAAFRARLRRLQPASVLVRDRIAGAHTPFATRLWPLGYSVQQYSPASAQVAVWELFVLGISGPLAQTTWGTWTVSLTWTQGDWKVTNTPYSTDLSPPGRNATTSQVSTWVDAVNRFDSYSYAP